MFSYIYIPLLLISVFFRNALTDSECKIVPSKPIDLRTNKQHLRLVQYNMEWVFVDYYKNADCPGNGCTWKNESDINIHLDHLTKVINELEPDILNICEIEGCDEINALINRTNDSYMPFLIKGTDSSTGQNVGLMTKITPNIDLYRSEMKVEYPIKNSQCNYNTNNTNTHGVSKHYITEFNINNMKIAMIGAHFLSMPTDPQRCAEREAQATVIQSIIKDYIQKQYEVIFIGDLNDFDKDVLDINNHIPTSQVLDILKGTYIDDYTLYSVAQHIPHEERFTNWWDSQNNCKELKENYSMIDHILTTKNIENKIKKAFMYHGYREYCGKWDSDHYPVVVDFEFDS